MNSYNKDYRPYDSIELPCGGVGCFDEGSGYGHRCDACGAVVGSIGQPRECVEEAKKWEANKILGGQSWEEYIKERDSK